MYIGMDLPADQTTTRTKMPTRVRALALVLALSVVTGGVFVADGFRAQALDTATSHYTSSLRSVEVQESAGAKAIVTVKDAAAAAQATLDGSASKVLAETERDALAAEISAAAKKVDAAERELQRAHRAVAQMKPADSPFGETFKVSAAGLEKIRFPASKAVRGSAAELAGASNLVTSAVAAWQVEQDRLAAAAAEAARVAAVEAERAAVAAAAAAADAASRRSSDTGSQTGSSSASSDYTKNVWTSGFQNEIDQCNGAVDVTAHYGPATIAEHWSCGGRSFPTNAGSTVTITGQRAGVYRVGGIVTVLDVDVDTASDVPRGYDLLYQTCINGSSATMSFTALTRIG